MNTEEDDEYVHFQLTEIINSQDQQIKYLESIIEHASVVISLKTNNTTFKKLLSEYQQKYPKQ